MAEKVDVVSIGAINVDIIAFMTKFPEAEEKIHSIDYMQYGATGVAVDCLTQVSKLGMKCGHIGKMGDDAYAEQVVKDFARDGIDQTHCTKIPGKRTALAWVFVNPKNGARGHVMHPMEGGNFEWEELEALSDYICGAKAVHMEMLQMPMDPLYHVAKMCREHGVVTSMDIDIAPHFLYEYGYSNPQLFLDTCSQIDLLKLCSGAIPDLTDEKDIEKAAAELYEKLKPTVLIITVGADGCVIAHKQNGELEVEFVPAFSGGGIKDTTGAGDAFQGGFIYGYLQGYPMRRVGELANACGYLEAQDIGARSSKERNEVEAFLREHGWDSL